MAVGARSIAAAAGAALLLALAVAYRHRRRRGALLALASPLGCAPPWADGEPAAAGWGTMRSKRRLVLLSNLRDMAGTLGLDIGGTMSKMVLAVAGGSEHSVVLGGGFREHQRLSFSVELDPASGSHLTLQFVATSTDRLAEAVRLLQSRVPQVSPPTRHKAARGQWKSSASEHTTMAAQGLRPIVTAGGGAHKYGKLFEETLGVRLVPFKELAALVEGEAAGACYLFLFGGVRGSGWQGGRRGADGECGQGEDGRLAWLCTEATAGLGVHIYPTPTPSF